MAGPSLIAQVLHSARFLSLATLISRFTGLFRDLTTAVLFGATPLLGAFMVAFRFSNLLRRLLGEGALNNAFIPIYKELSDQSPKRADTFYYTLRSFLLFGLLALVLFVEGGLSIFTGSLSESNNHILLFTMIMFPGLLLISFYSLCAAYLNCKKKFFLAGLGPACFNLIWIAFAFVAYRLFGDEGLWILAYGVLVSYVAEWIICDLAFYKKFVFRGFFSQVKNFLPEFKRLLAYFSLTAIGVGASQINSALDAVFARYALLEGPCYLWYAIRIQQLPLALIGITLATVSFPLMAEKGNDLKELFSFLTASLKKKIAYLIPMTFLMIALGLSGLNLLYGHGAFSSEDVWETFYCFIAYSLGLFPMSLSLLLANFFYSQGDYKIPSKAAVLSVFCNVALNALFIFHFQFGTLSVALATSLSSIFNCLYLCFYIQKQEGCKALFPWKYFLKILLLGLSVFLAIGLFQEFFTLRGAFSFINTHDSLSRFTWTQLKVFFMEGIAAVLFLALGSYLFKCSEVLEIFSLFLPRRKKR
jgi:putative peptidoglycan lipid II flippase